MLAYIATSKFEDHLPLHRLERIFRREGALIARSTMCDWLAATANCLTPVYERMCQRIRQSNVIWTDDTPVEMLDREDPRNMRTARLWVYLGDRQNPFTIFDFTESRRRDGPLKFLGDFSGYLQADAFAGYDCIFAGGTVREAACWAHARRKFFEALDTASAACSEALLMIQSLYSVERAAQNLSDEERCSKRNSQALPILQRFKSWLDHQTVVALPKSPLRKAVMYALNNWSALNTYLRDGALSIDNNKSERAIRSVAIGRKNWLFMGSANGGRTAAVIMSLIASCKQQSIHPRVYLDDVLTRLSLGETDYDSLLPGNWTPAA